MSRSLKQRKQRSKRKSRLKKPTLDSEMAKLVVNEEKCTNCGTCISVCPVNVFEKGEKKVKVAKPGDCIGCRACEVQCPESAIKVEDE